MKKILFVASECVPFVKTGGLADVVGALPKYFDKEKYEVRVVLPRGFIIISSTMNIILMGINHMATFMKMWKSSHSFPERLCLSCQ